MCFFSVYYCFLILHGMVPAKPPARLLAAHKLVCVRMCVFACARSASSSASTTLWSTVFKPVVVVIVGMSMNVFNAQKQRQKQTTQSHATLDGCIQKYQAFRRHIHTNTFVTTRA